MRPSRLLTSVAEQLSDAIILADSQGRVTWINSAFTRLCGYTLEEMRGRKPGHLLQGPDTDPEAVARLRHAVREHEPANVEMLNYRKDGSPYAVAIALTPLRTRTGRLRGFMAVERETSPVHRQLRRLENQVVELYEVLCHAGTDART